MHEKPFHAVEQLEKILNETLNHLSVILKLLCLAQRHAQKYFVERSILFCRVVSSSTIAAISHYALICVGEEPRYF